MRICDPLLPVLARDFDTSLAAAAATTTGFALAYGGTQLFFGPLGDRVGRLPVIVVAILVAATASVACALAPTLQVLVAARVATGAFAAAAIPLSLAWIGDNVPFGERQPVLARYLIGQMLGMTAGQIGGGFLADLIGWRFAFWGLAVLFTGAALMLFRSMQHELAARRTAAAAAATARAAGDPPQGAAASGFLQQCRVLFSDRWAVTVIGTVSLEGVLLFGAVALIASHLQRNFGVSPSVAGTVSALFGLGGLFYALNAGKLIARLRAPGLCRMGGGLIAAAMLILLLQPVWQPAVAATLMAGLGYYMLHNTLQTQATQLSVQARGAAVAWFASGLWLGQGIGVSLAAAAAERFGFGVVFAVTAVGLGVLGTAFAGTLRARARRRRAGSTDSRGDPTRASAR